ncbi:MAG: MBOAT family protein [Lachnospiraceae bacterium]|nr:MBOAT family protein [Lachnospiraceae bacterium]
MIQFSDMRFIFRILPILLIAYYLLPAKARPWILLLGSLAFYAVDEPYYFLLLVGATLVNYLLGRGSFHKKTALFVVSVLLDVGLLAGFKIMDMWNQNFLLPLGLSFYVFKMISYQSDLYHGRIRRATFRDTAVYFTMFPQILSGPITRFSYIEGNDFWRGKHYGKSKKNYLLDIFYQLDDGVRYFVLGLALKVILADHLAILWKEIGTIGYESISTPLAWLGVVAYSLTLYFDFWGYSLMAAGLGVMLGFPFVRNFDQPYSAASVSDFYRRWHMTLGQWFRDYVYIPMGGSRKGSLRTLLNLIVVWLLTGLWHGAGGTFLLWAGALCLIIIWEKFVLKKAGKLGKVLGHVHVLILIPLSWIIFALPTMQDIGIYFSRLFPFFGQGVAVNASDILTNLKAFWGYLVAGFVMLIPGWKRIYQKYKNHDVMTMILFVVFWLCVYSLANAMGNPFYYLRF